MTKLISWNVWGMPFKNPECYRNTVGAIQNTIDENINSTPHTVIAIQECWVWRAGCLGYVSQERIKNWYSVALTCIHLIGLMCTCCFGRSYNPMDHVDTYQYHVIQDYSIGWNKLNNSGLVFITNIMPDRHGFVRFKRSVGLERISCKGFQYMYYGTTNTLYINTHLQSGGKLGVRLSQILQIQEFIQSYIYTGCVIFVVGDFNLDARDTDERICLNELGLVRINNISPTTPDGEVIDHCMTNIVELVKEFTIGDCDMSDHYRLEIIIREKN